MNQIAGIPGAASSGGRLLGIKSAMNTISAKTAVMPKNAYPTAHFVK